MSYLFLFIPAIGWGLMPMFVAGVKKSNIYHQILGTVIGAFIFGAAVTLIKCDYFYFSNVSWCCLGYWSSWSVLQLFQGWGF